MNSSGSTRALAGVPRIGLALVAAAAMLLALVAPTLGTSGGAAPRSEGSVAIHGGGDATVMVMKHNCADVSTTEEFEAVEARAATNPTTPDAAFGPTVETVLECPTVVLEGDTQTPDTVAGGTSAFDFTVADGSTTQTLSTDGAFTQTGACETDVAYDADRNGSLDADVCLDLSHYEFAVAGDSDVTVTEITPPAGFAFGALRFTPGSGDEASLVSASNGVIELDTSADDDGMIMLHVYNFAVAAAPSDATVMVMKHNCADVSTMAEFDAVEARAATNPTTPDAAFGPTVETVLECPTVVLDGDTQTPGAVAGGTSAFDFTVADSDGTQTLSTDGDFMQVGACEPDVAYDATRNGTLDADVCLDLSHYGFSVEDGTVTITETTPPSGFAFGALRFTPGSGDDAALVSSSNGVIVLDTTADDDGMIMLHVYNFAVAAGAPSPTPAASELPDAAIGSDGSFSGTQLALLLGGLTLASSVLVGHSVTRARRSR
ncbi:MAG: hypothetical protein K5924_12240 [Chloroflexi bacterium]|nr:hypothetical protein [Chloroflexota bacterium]